MQIILPPPKSKPWRELYLTALFETNPIELPDRIADAEKALALRARELFQTTGDHIEEESAMDDAVYALHALRTTSRYANSQPKSKAEAA